MHFAVRIQPEAIHDLGVISVMSVPQLAIITTSVSLTTSSFPKRSSLT
jgi:hypothetical protein